jgi:hypothetical protein
MQYLTLDNECLMISGTAANFTNGRDEVGYYLFSEFPSSLPFGDTVQHICQVKI